jgi:hypothetical protein
MAGGIDSSQQFVGISVGKPSYSGLEFGSPLARYDNTEAGIAEAHGHADQLAERLSIPREAVRVARYTSTTSLEALAQPTPKAPKASSNTTPKPSVSTAVITKGGKSKTVNLKGK